LRNTNFCAILKQTGYVLKGEEVAVQKIMPCLWFDSQTEEAIALYMSCFAGSKIIELKRYPEGYSEGPLSGMEGKVLTAIFELAGQRFMALDGGPTFKFTPAISLFVSCADEAEVDRVWERLADGGSILMPLQAYPFSPRFGWLADKFGVSWQVSLGARPQKIAPFLMFVGAQHGKAEEALRLYTSLFEHAAIERIERYGVGDDGQPGTVKHALFQLCTHDFMAIDSSFAHPFTFTEAISLYVECATQEEVDRLWATLSAHPDAEACGWLKDRYGVSWQIVPSVLGDLLNDPDPVKSGRVMDAMLQMKKLDIAALQTAYAG
jgi:predicted 3-demethylubiquinone-9 3-methyltransferase (glyoxalase superfamily)